MKLKNAIVHFDFFSWQANPPATVTWRLRGQRIAGGSLEASGPNPASNPASDPNFKILEDFSLQINSVREGFNLIWKINIYLIIINKSLDFFEKREKDYIPFKSLFTSDQDAGLYTVTADNGVSIFFKSGNVDYLSTLYMKDTTGDSARSYFFTCVPLCSY